MFNVEIEEVVEVRNEDVNDDEVIDDENNVVGGGSFLFIPAVAPSPADATSGSTSTIGEALSMGLQVGMINCLLSIRVLGELWSFQLLGTSLVDYYQYPQVTVLLPSHIA